MKCLINLCAVLIFGAAICESLAADASPDQTELAKKLIIPRIGMRDVPAGMALPLVKQKSNEVDPDKKGVNLVFTDLPESARKNVVNFQFEKDVSVFDLIERVAKATELEVTARKDAIIVHAKGTKP